VWILDAEKFERVSHSYAQMGRKVHRMSSTNCAELLMRELKKAETKIAEIER
jgi:hypothetical protein